MAHIIYIVINMEDDGEVLGAYDNESNAERARLRYCEEQPTSSINVTVLSLLTSQINRDLWV